jgi:hypothetical protein
LQSSGYSAAKGRAFFNRIPTAIDRADQPVKRLARHASAVGFQAADTWLTRRSCGRSLAQIVERLRAYVPGWKGYFRASQTPGVFRHLDEWLRHRLRAVQLKHWKRGKTIYPELLALGARPAQARRVAANSRRWWRNSRYEFNRLMPIAYFDRPGAPRLS